MEELETNLQNYMMQLQQVEAALTTSPDSDELMKLKSDLEEVITLTKDLIKAQVNDDRDEGVDEVPELLSKPEPYVPPKRDWKPGDICMALLVQDGQYYEARIETIEGDEVSVIFSHNRSAEVITLDFIREASRMDGSRYRQKRQPASKVREYQKKKKMKKQQRHKQLEEERESEKNKWLAFSSKATKKGGVSKKSIFASPDNVNGRVGIGTCGVSGKGMTDFVSAEKWRKGT